MQPSALFLLLSVIGLGGCFYVGTDDPPGRRYPSSPPPLVGQRPPMIPDASAFTDWSTTGPHSVSEMLPSMSVESDGITIKVSAALRAYSDDLRTSDGDYFTATVGEDTVVMNEQKGSEQGVHYVATFPVQSGSAMVLIAFVRRNGKAGAPFSIVELPAPFTITSDLPASVTLGESLKVVASTYSSLAEVLVTGPCIQDMVPQMVAGGTELHFDTAQLLPKYVSAGCDVIVELRHKALGEVDRGFLTSVGTTPVIEARQDRSFVTNLITP